MEPKISEDVKSFYAVLGLLIIAFSPLGVMWALNSLFKLEIVYCWKNWLAVLILLFVLGIVSHINTPVFIEKIDQKKESDEKAE